MKKHFAFVFSVILLASCHSVKYADPQPVFWPSVPSFPKQLQGSYPLMGAQDGLVVGKQTITIKEDRTYTLGEDLILKRYQGYWIVSIKQEENKGWEVYAADKNKGIKKTTLRKDEMFKLNELLGREVVLYDAYNEELPLEIKRREFKKILKAHFEGVEIK